jgi:type 1 glutamine amidotransferase
MKKPIALLALFLGASLLASAADAKKLLIVTVTKGFRHSSIGTAEKVLGKLAGDDKNGFSVDYARTDEELASKMSASALKQYDGFIFANTTGILPLPDKQAFLNELKNGKAFVGMHSASDTFHGPSGVDPYTEMLGGEFASHHAQAGVECLVQDNKHPANKALGEAYCIEQEEMYLMKNYNADGKVHELLVLDKHPNNKKKTGHFPVAWCKEYGKGKVFYTSLGHREDVWENQRYQKHIVGGIRWALGLEPGDAAPQAKPLSPIAPK